MLQGATRVRGFPTRATRIRFVTSSRRVLGVILAVAALHAALYIAHERPEWSTAWTDQGGYRLLAEGLRQTGSFTRFPGVSPFVGRPGSSVPYLAYASPRLCLSDSGSDPGEAKARRGEAKVGASGRINLGKAPAPEGLAVRLKDSR